MPTRRYRILLIIVMATVFDLYGSAMYGDTQNKSWRKPTFVKWDNEGILLGGITLREMRDFYVWSVNREEILWYISLKVPRYKTYSDDSRFKSILLKYNSLPDGYKQRFPKESIARLPEIGEIVKVYFCYTMDWFFGPRFETVETYLKVTNEEYQKIDVSIDCDVENLKKNK